MGLVFSYLGSWKYSIKSKTIMLPPSSSLPASSAIAPPITGPTLHPRTPTQPRPGFIAQSPDLRVTTFCLSPIPKSLESDADPSVYEVSSNGESDTTDGIGSVGSVEVVGNVGPSTGSKKKKAACKSKAKVHVVKRRGRPCGSGASSGLA
ncbi:uncharacterized protein MELLADRAFT_89429 [Melampsora larici-populina 98AG31]|uniref:Uncharacterized protein n=1 Tax=Melampsora larici-populina (strain 98AG31 / pathotype 3-4-7) TaxID=747676 RepID=F4RTA6_MELLP|nr:uncharacterized protein MELLADRAFT_89429 [Melampsora larici-populina 98AG31]EGG04228.1 hypothetical protein MELLADRAFT_89429 [Melampsora larici-populina 98AG31]